MLARLPEVFFLGIATGGFDVVAAAVFRSNEHLYELMTKRLARIAGIQRTSTLGIVRIVKRAYAYPVPAIEPPAAPDEGGAGPDGDGCPPRPAGPEPLRACRAEARGARVSYLTHLECFRRGRQYPPGRLFQGCPACADARPSNLFCVYDYGRLAGAFGPGKLEGRPSTMWRYRELLPVSAGPVVSLDEGMTPLIHCPRLGARYGLRRLFVKDESRNPTWSFKDRMAAVAATKARELGCGVLAIGSTGNAGAATAAYAARAGLRAVILTTPNVPAAMRPFMQAYGATVVAVPTLPDRWTLVREGVERTAGSPCRISSRPGGG